MQTFVSELPNQILKTSAKQLCIQSLTHIQQMFKSSKVPYWLINMKAVSFTQNS